MTENLFGNTMDWTMGDDNLGGGMGITFPQTAETQRKDASELLHIVGYIASRKNSLTKHFDVGAATETYREKFDELAGGNKTVTLENGIEIKRSFSQKNFIALFGEGELDRLKESNFYKLNVKEGNPEFLVLKSDVADKGDQQLASSTRSKTAVSDPDSKVLLIKPRNLSDILYTTSAKGFIFIEIDGKKVGLFSPQKLKSVDKNGNEKIALRYFPVLESGAYGKYVPQLGVIKGIPHAVNRNFAGQPIQGEINLSNKKQIEDRYPELLDQLHTIGESLPREATKGTDQYIAYEEYADVYEKLGITPNMLDNLRTTKASRRTREFTIADIISGFNGEFGE